MSSWKCQVCEQPVSHGGIGFSTEETFKIWHNKCFRCSECDLLLNDYNYRARDGKPYCFAHYGSNSATDNRGSFVMLPLAGMKKLLGDCDEGFLDVIVNLVFSVIPLKPPAKKSPRNLKLPMLFPAADEKFPAADEKPQKSPEPVTDPIASGLRRMGLFSQPIQEPSTSKPEAVVNTATEPEKKNRVIVSNSASGDKTMELAIGSICEEKVDVIVNSVGTDLDMTKGELSKAMLRAAGVEIKTELLQQGGAPPAKSGSIIVTKGYKLSCKNVLHVILNPWSNAGQCVQNLRELINRILSKADELKVRSIAFPPLGVGNLDYPRNTAAQVLYMEVMNYLDNNVDSGLQRVIFAVLEEERELIKMFREFLIKGTSDHKVEDHEVKLEDEDEQLRIFGTFMKEYTKGSRVTDVTIPDWWKMSLTSTQPYTRFELNPTDSEYKDVVRLMRCRNGKDFTKLVYKIERIENHFLWTVYNAIKQGIVRTNGKGMQNERKLWHGTNVKSVEDIVASGFNRCFNGRALYGKGVYFAHEFSYSAQDNYSPPDCLGCKYVFLCRVMVGYFCKGYPELLQPPTNIKTRHPYNSAVDNEAAPMVFVTFRDYTMYPDYLITLFRK